MILNNYAAILTVLTEFKDPVVLMYLLKILYIILMYNCHVTEVAPYITRPQGVGSQFVKNAGTTITLPCHAYGTPQPTVTWYKNRYVPVCTYYWLKNSQSTSLYVTVEDKLNLKHKQELLT